MPRILILLFLLLFTSCKEQLKDEEKVTVTKSPNFLVIIADDAGWNDVGYHGSDIKTPNIDALAAKGIVLERLYASPTCSPSRASLLSGMPASRIGILAPIGGKSEKSLPDSITTLPQLLKKVNYQTALIGKWHLGLKPITGPKAYGFDYSYGYLHGQIDQYTHKYKNGDESWYRNSKLVEEEGHTTDLLTADTIDWITKKRDSTKSFYLQLAYSAPHFPLQEEEKWKAPYRDLIENDSRRDYAAAMTHMDYSMGLVLETLKKNGLEENTIILFVSDNGGQESWTPNTQYNGVHKPNDVLGDNMPLRDWKNSNYEGGIRVPGIFYWKDHVNPHYDNTYMSMSDFMPSIASLTPIMELPKAVEGKNVFDVLMGKETLNERVIYVRGKIQENIIKKPWKLIRTRGAEQTAVWELFNIELDPEEKEDKFGDDHSLDEELIGLLKAEFKKDEKNIITDPYE